MSINLGIEPAEGYNHTDLVYTAKQQGYSFVAARVINADEFSYKNLAITDSTLHESTVAVIDSENPEAISWASHVGVSAVCFELQDSVTWARFTASWISKFPYSQIWVRCPAEQWTKWNRIRCIVGSKLNVCVTVNKNIDIAQWAGEPISAICINESIINEISRGLLRFIMDRNLHLVIKSKLIVSYLNVIKKAISNVPIAGYLESFAPQHNDLLQIPLQPLFHNLEEYTYLTFERDPVKYQLYESAIRECFRELNRPLVVFVVGVGARGPLIDCCLRCQQETGIKLKIIGVEKNKNALYTLKNKTWPKNVEIIETDMRSWNPEVKCDVLLSELLGSFGDNELSPECLESVYQHLKPNGICIPQSYSSYLAPISSSKLHQNAQKLGLENMYVAKMHSVSIVSKPALMWTFEHPCELQRHKEHNFIISQDSIVHGFAGYFDCTLYKNIKMSIVPEKHSTNMTSWFPAFFPLCYPVNVKKGNQFRVNMWRLTDQRRVWYEWMCMPWILNQESVSIASKIHNLDGSSYSIFT